MVRLVTSALFALFAALPAYAFQFGSMDNQSNQNFSIAGNVYYGDTGRPAEHITVELRGSDDTLHAPQTTSGTGGYEFRRLIRGSYEIVINCQGYEPVNITIDISVASTRGMTIYLKPILNEQRRSSSGPISAHELSMPQKARDLVTSGKKKLYQQRDPQSGLQDFQQAVSIAPDYYEADYQVGIAYLALGKPDDAEKNLRKSIEISHDNYAEPHVALGQILLDKGDTSGAEKTLLRGVELNPASSRGFYELGRAQITEKKLPEAEKAALQARTLAPDFPMVYRLLSIIHLQQKNYNALMEDLDAYIKLDPDSPAGLRAKQMRDQVHAKLATEPSPQPQTAKP